MTRPLSELLAAADALKVAPRNEIVTLAAAATPGPWDSDNDEAVYSLGHPHFNGNKTYRDAYNDPNVRLQPFVVCKMPDKGCYVPHEIERRNKADARFIAAARNIADELAHRDMLVSELVEVVRALSEERDSFQRVGIQAMQERDELRAKLDEAEKKS
jgi:hypothetical protein